MEERAREPSRVEAAVEEVRRGHPGGFTRFANSVSHVAGSPPAFALAVALVVLWATTGPLFGFSETWQLIINTGTTIVTFLMVFLIQSTQNRDSRAIHLKLDAIIDAFDEIREDMVDIEHASDEELEAAQDEFRRRRDTYEPRGARRG